MNSEYIIQLENISKSFGKTTALADVQLSICKGEIFGLVGPDGAGKSTILKAICGLVIPEQGTIAVLGIDAIKGTEKLRSKLGYMPQRFSLYQDLKLTENMNFYANIFGIAKKSIPAETERFLQLTGLYEHRDKLAGQLSGGMKQKLALAVNLMHQPEILLLDEPSTGVDPVARKDFWSIINKMKEEGITIVVATPYMEEAERCDTIALIARGRVAASGNLPVIIDLFPYNITNIVTHRPFELKQIIDQKFNFVSTMIRGNAVRVISTEPSSSVEATIEHIMLESESISPALAEVEDTFIYLTKEGASNE